MNEKGCKIEKYRILSWNYLDEMCFWDDVKHQTCLSSPLTSLREHLFLNKVVQNVLGIYYLSRPGASEYTNMK
jgi:hypothetical protein